MLVFDKKTDTNARKKWRKIAGLEDVSPLKGAESKAPILKDTNAVYWGGGLGQSLVGVNNCDACKTDNKVDTGGGDGGDDGSDDGSDDGGDMPSPSITGGNLCVSSVDPDDGFIIVDSQECCPVVDLKDDGEKYTNIIININEYIQDAYIDTSGAIRETIAFTLPGEHSYSEINAMYGNLVASKTNGWAEILPALIEEQLRNSSACSEHYETIYNETLNCGLKRLKLFQEITRNGNWYFNLLIAPQNGLGECDNFTYTCNTNRIDLYQRSSLTVSVSATASSPVIDTVYYAVYDEQGNMSLVKCN